MSTYSKRRFIMRRHIGFTLVELAIVLVIIGLIMGMAMNAPTTKAVGL